MGEFKPNNIREPENGREKEGQNDRVPGDSLEILGIEPEGDDSSEVQETATGDIL
jgi:hypothetical protein